ncbi:ANTAR domain-containing protein [Geodermatophilus sp. SYSU D01045]
MPADDGPRERLGLQDALLELSRVELDPSSLAATLTRVAELAAAALAGTAEASVTLVRSAGAVTVGVTGPVAAELDERQYDAGFGPCTDAATSGVTVTIPDTATEEGYRDFAALARRHGVTGVLSVGMPLDHRVVGSLNLYRTDGGASDDAALEAAQTFARFAAGAVDHAAAYAGAEELGRHLRRAMQSRAVVEQAKGVLMAQHGCTADEAFTMLARESQHRNRKLRVVAAELVAAVQRSR